jgi:hypothetical protein
VRKLWPLAVVLALGAATPLAAQLSLTSFSGSRGKQTTSPPPTAQTVGVTQMIPKINVNNALVHSPNAPRPFSFSQVLPNFSWINSRWPLNVGRSQTPVPGQTK